MGPYDRRSIQSQLHSLASGASDANWVRDNRASAGRRVADLISANDLGTAGLAIHYFGDSYAHTFGPNNDQAYTAPIGHLWQKHVPDDMYDRPHLARAYAEDLSRNIARGLGTPSGQMASVVRNGISLWERTFNENRNESSFSNRAASIERELYINIRGPSNRSINVPFNNKTLNSGGGAMVSYRSYIQSIRKMGVIISKPVKFPKSPK